MQQGAPMTPWWLCGLRPFWPTKYDNGQDVKEAGRPTAGTRRRVEWKGVDVARSPFLRLHRLPSAEGRARGSWSSRQSARGLASAWVFWSQADPGHTFILAATELSRARARAALLCVQTPPPHRGAEAGPEGVPGRGWPQRQPSAFL